MTKAAANDLFTGEFVNLGSAAPTLVNLTSVGAADNLIINLTVC
jgi:hypothetical protein